MAVVAAGRAIKRNKLRAALTMLGIFIGVAAVITMVAVGDGAKASVEAQINSLGTNLLIVVPGATTANGVRAGFGSNSTLTVGDAEAIARRRRPGRAGDATWIGSWRRWSSGRSQLEHQHPGHDVELLCDSRLAAVDRAHLHRLRGEGAAPPYACSGRQS